MVDFLSTITFMCSDMQDGWTALMWATITGKCDVVTELISLGADVDIQDIVRHFLMSYHDTGKMAQDHQVHSLVLTLSTPWVSPKQSRKLLTPSSKAPIYIFMDLWRPRTYYASVAG